MLKMQYLIHITLVVLLLVMCLGWSVQATENGQESKNRPKRRNRYYGICPKIPAWALCPRNCRKEFYTDEYGCDNCRCKKNSNQDTSGICPKIPAWALCPRNCPKEFYTDEYGCDNCRCKKNSNQDTSDACQLPHETGHCRAAFQRFYFNSTSGKCELFIYGGCGGNGNNFKYHDECIIACKT